MRPLNQKSETRSEQILRWLDEVEAPVKTSQWGPVFERFEIDLWDALKMHLFLALLRAGQRGSPGKQASIYDRILNRLRDGLLGVRTSQSPKQNQLDSARIIFWPAEFTHANQQIPVSKKFDQRQISNRFVCCKARIQQFLSDQNVNSVFLPDFFSDRIGRARIGGPWRDLISQDISTRLPELIPGLSAREHIQILRDTLLELIPTAEQSLLLTDSLIDDFSAEAIVVGYDLSVQGRVAALRSKMKGCKTFWIMNASFAGSPLQGLHRVDKILAMGDGARSNLRLSGQDEAKIIVCGSPGLDERPQPCAEVDPRIRKKLKIDPRERIALVALSGAGGMISAQHHQKMIEAVVRLSAKYPKIRFVAKLHQKDQPELYLEAKKKISGAHMDVVTYGQRGFPVDIFSWLKGCSVVLTGASMVAVEAMLMDVPVLTMDFNNEISNIDFIDAGASLHSVSEAQLAEVFERADSLDEIQKAKVKKFLENCFFKLDGKASDRCAEEILRSI